MMVVDTSASMTDELHAVACMAAIKQNNELLLSAHTMVEVLIVAGRCEVEMEMLDLISGLGLEVASIVAASARRGYRGVVCGRAVGAVERGKS